MKFPIHWIKLDPMSDQKVIALRTSGTVKKGEQYSILMIDEKGRVALNGDEQWLPMSMFAWANRTAAPSPSDDQPVLAPEAQNDNG